MSQEQWYYSQAGGAQQGPVSLTRLREMAADTALQPEDLLWSPGMESWSPARSVRGVLPEPASPPVPAAAPPLLAGTTPPPLAGTNGPPLLARGRGLLGHAADRTRGLEDADTAEKLMPHVRLIGRLLEVFAAAISDPLLDQVDRTARRVGHIAYVVAVLFFVIFYAALAIKVDSMQIFFVSLLGIVPVALVGHYTAVMFLEAGNRLIPNLPSRVFSRVFLSCAGLIFLFAALVLLLGGFFLLIKTSDWGGFGAALAASAVVFYLGAVSLKPSSLHIEIGEEAGVGEEALGIFSFLIKMLLRLVPVVFGVGSVAGVGAAVYFLILLIGGEIFSIGIPVIGDLSILDVTGGVLGLGILPLAAYLAFVVLHLAVELLRAVLQVPGRLEGLRQAVAGE